MDGDFGLPARAPGFCASGEARHPVNCWAARSGGPWKMLIDSHVHLEDRKFTRDLDRVLERADDAGIADCLHCGPCPNQPAVGGAGPAVPPAIGHGGLHPNHVRRFGPRRSANCGSWRAILPWWQSGRRGWIFTTRTAIRTRQIEALRAQAELASELGCRWFCIAGTPTRR
jgi:Tat protein secretion system quality control protein TatD with DNase activity